MSALDELSQVLTSVSAAIAPSVVGIGSRLRGSGVVIGDGRVLTNAHNVRGDEVTVTFAGWALGTAIRLAIPLAEPLRFFVECGLWLVVVAVAASPLAIESVRARLTAAIPH